MAFERLQSLGEDKFKKLSNMLMTGTPAMAVARTIRGEWKDLEDMGEKTLTQSLNRLRIAIAKGVYGDDAKAILEDNTKITLKYLKGSSIIVLQELTALAGMQERRLQDLWDLERKTGKFNVHINNVMESYKSLVLDIQRVRFDLGMDEFKGVVPGMKGTVERVERPDGSVAQRTTFDIVTLAQAKIQQHLGA